MSHRFFASIRVRLILLILIAVAPICVLMLYSGQEEYRLATEHVQTDTLRMVRLVSEEHERFIEEARQLLTGLSRLSEVRHHDSEGCGRIFSELLQQYPHYNDIGAVDADGGAFCSAHKLTAPVSASDRGWFKQAVKEGRFSLGEYQIGRVTGKAGLAFGYPVPGAEGRVREVVFAILDLGWFSRVAVTAELPPGSTLTVRDRNGTILSRHPDPDKWIGKSAPDAPILLRILAGNGEGTAESTGIDGVNRLYAFKPLRSGQEPGLYLSIGIPARAAYFEVERSLRRNLIGLGLATLFAFLVTGFFGNSLILRQVRALLVATKRLSAGDLTARTGIPYGRGELPQLARAFDEMAESVEQLTGELSRAETRYRALIEQLPAVIYIAEVGEQGNMIYISPQIEAMLGCPPREWLADPNFWASRLHPEDRDRVIAERDHSRTTGAPFSSEYRVRAGTGQFIWVRDEAAELKDGEGNSICLQGIMRDVTEGKRAEEALLRSEAKFRSLLESAPTAIIIHSSGSFRYANPAATAISGYMEQDLARMPFWEIIHPDFREMIREDGLAMQRGRSAPSRYEAKIITKTGEERWIDLRAHVMEFEGEAVVFCAALDVTERKQAEEAVRDLSRRNKSILDSVDQAIVGLSLDGKITFTNPAVSRITGWSAEELIGKHHHALLHHTRADGTPYPVEECPHHMALRAGRGHQIESDLFWRKDGLGFPVDYTSTPMRDEAGRLVGAVATFKDVSDRKKTEEERLRLAAAIEQAAESVVMTDVDGIIQYVNPAFERMSGYMREEAVGERIDILRTVKPDGSFYPSLLDSIARGDTWSGRMTCENRGGSRCEVETTISPVRDGSGVIINHVALLRDVTHEARMEKQLQQAHKMEAIGTLAGGIAHDFNNILGAIIGYAELTSCLLPQNSPAQRNLEQVTKAGNRAKELVKQILAFSRQSGKQQKPLLMSPIVKEALKLIRASLPSTIDIHLNIEVKPATDTILADPTQIHQVIMNLCTNAAHAMRGKGGRLEVGLVEVDVDTVSAAGYAGMHPGPHLKLCVSDTGSGMDPFVKERIFDPFFTTKGPGEGTGLGLSVVHGIVKDHGGVITVHSELGKGSSFCVFLPKAEDTDEENPVDFLPFLEGAERILLVDDEEPLARSGSEGLTLLGYDVVATTSSVEALEVFRSNPDRFDLVITDYTMPNMTGDVLARQILKIRPDIPIVLCTGFSEVIGVEGAKATGIRELLMKPVGMRELALTIRKVMDAVKS